jgi:hypothetical protein
MMMEQFLNTLILLSSGAAVTLAHHAILAGKEKRAVYALVATVSLALVFTGFQGMEYYQAPLTRACVGGDFLPHQLLAVGEGLEPKAPDPAPARNPDPLVRGFKEGVGQEAGRCARRNLLSCLYPEDARGCGFTHILISAITKGYDFLVIKAGAGGQNTSGLE